MYEPCTTVGAMGAVGTMLSSCYHADCPLPHCAQRSQGYRRKNPMASLFYSTLARMSVTFRSGLFCEQ
jgi:hypothetical protein